MKRTNPPVKPFFMRLPQVLSVFPVSRSTFLNGVQTGKYPKSYRLSERTTAWKRSDIEKLCEKLTSQTN